MAKFLRTDFATSWSPDGFQVWSLLGLGGKWGIDTPTGSKYLVAEWEYPDVGVVIFDMPSGGHDVVMLDYRESEHEPAVVYADEDRVPRRVANSFAEFVDALGGTASRRSSGAVLNEKFPAMINLNPMAYLPISCQDH